MTAWFVRSLISPICHWMSPSDFEYVLPVIRSPSPEMPSSVRISMNRRYLPPRYGGSFSTIIVLSSVIFILVYPFLVAVAWDSYDVYIFSCTLMLALFCVGIMDR